MPNTKSVSTFIVKFINHFPFCKYSMSCKLSVNINKIALIRNSRGEGYPDLLKVAKDCEVFGADGITVHPRPDERHVKFEDVRMLKELVSTELNVEGYPSKRFLDLIAETRPHQCTLVPDKPDALTSNQGWDTRSESGFLTDIIAEIKSYGVRVSLFVDPIEQIVEGASEVGADRIEFYTGPYAKIFKENPLKAVEKYAMAAKFADHLKIGINAGHDLNLYNLKYLYENIPSLLEVSIGHALISDAIYLGLENTIQMYKRCLGK